YIENANEREHVIKLLNYGGQLVDRDVVFALFSQKKQDMVWKAGKDTPHVVRGPDVPDSKGNVKEFLKKLFAQTWYYTPEEIEKDNNERFQLLQRKNPKSPQSSGKTQRKTSRKSAVSPGVQKRREKGLPSRDEKPKDDGDRGPITI